MSKKRNAFMLGFMALLVVQLACEAPMLNKDNASPYITVPLGPQLTQTELQSQTLENIFAQIESNYVYYKSSSIDWNALHKKYQSEIDKKLTAAEFNELMSQFVSEFPEGDIIYSSREERITSDTAANTANYGSIGAFVSFQAEDEPHVVVLDVIPGSPAEKAGLKAHDSIYAVDGEPVHLEEGPDVVLRIRGEAGTKVTLTVHTPGKNEREIELTRAQVTASGILIVDEFPNANIGYIRFPTIGDTTLNKAVEDALKEFSTNKELKGIILDLRIAGIKSNFPLGDMLTLFMDGIQLDEYSNTKEQTFTVNGQDIAGSQTIPLVVLVGEHTSGNAEIFTSAVQESGRGTVIGSDTSGSIEGLTGFVLPNGGQLYIASSSLRAGVDENLGIKGVQPEVRVEAKWDEIIAAEDPVIQRAVESFEVQP